MICALLAAALAGGSFAATHPWPLREPFTVMDTVSTLQFYGGTAGFHHGTDLRTRAGAAVYAPVGGVVSAGYYYPRRQMPYTYMVAIREDDGRRWEFHHVDPASVPPAILALAASGGRVAPGTLLARVYDAAAIGIPPHVHVDVIEPSGVYQNGLRFFPRLPDRRPPEIRGVYFVGPDDKAALETRAKVAEASLAPGRYDLVVDARDEIPPAPREDSLYALEVRVNGRPAGAFKFDELPEADYLKGVEQVYRVKPFADASGAVVQNQVELDAPRRFLFRFPFEQPPGAGKLVIDVRATDYAGNTARRTFVIVPARVLHPSVSPN